MGCGFCERLIAMIFAEQAAVEIFPICKSRATFRIAVATITGP
jgi:hypothetical protein